jgi:hypothetical protein
LAVIFGSPLFVLYVGSLALAAIIVILYIYLFNSAREAGLIAQLRSATADRADGSDLQRRIRAIRNRQIRVISYLRYGGLFLFGVVFVFAGQYGVFLFGTNMQKVYDSNQYWRHRYALPTSYARLSATRLFSVYDDRVVAGETPANNDSIVITAEIHDPLHFNSCPASETTDIVRSANVTIAAPGLTLSHDPTIQESQVPCYVKWNWIGVPKEGGEVYALLGVTLREPRDAFPPRAAKILDIRVQQPFTFDSAVPLIAAVISLLGAIATTMLSGFLSRKNAASHESQPAA